MLELPKMLEDFALCEETLPSYEDLYKASIGVLIVEILTLIISPMNEFLKL